MRILDRYIARTVLMVCLVVLFTIAGLDTLFAFISELEDVGDRYSLEMATRHTLLTVPRRIYEFVPMSILVGCLVGLGTLANSSELTVMRAAGISKYRILGAVMQPVLILMLLCGLLGEFIAPKTEQAAVAERALAFGGGQAIGSQYGFWHRDGDWFMHITAIRPNGQLSGVTIYELDDERNLLSSAFARQADYQGDHWLLKQIEMTYFETNRTRMEKLPELRWNSELDPELLTIVAADPAKMSMQSLYRYSDYMQAQDVNATPYKLAFWNKLLLPLAIIGLVLVAMSFVFGPLRSVTMGQRVVVGIMVGLLFKTIQDLLGPASTVFGFSPLIAALTPILICYLAGGWFLRKAG